MQTGFVCPHRHCFCIHNEMCVFGTFGKVAAESISFAFPQANSFMAQWTGPGGEDAGLFLDPGPPPIGGITHHTRLLRAPPTFAGGPAPAVRPCVHALSTSIFVCEHEGPEPCAVCSIMACGHPGEDPARILLPVTVPARIFVASHSGNHTATDTTGRQHFTLG